MLELAKTDVVPLAVYVQCHKYPSQKYRPPGVKVAPGASKQISVCRAGAHQPCHPERSEAESKDLRTYTGTAKERSLDFARDDSVCRISNRLDKLQFTVPVLFYTLPLPLHCNTPGVPEKSLAAKGFPRCNRGSVSDPRESAPGGAHCGDPAAEWQTANFGYTGATDAQKVPWTVPIPPICPYTSPRYDRKNISLRTGHGQ